ncbi:MAG: biotin synthase BioB [Bacteroidia bacterium]|nr:biotin synthase BioB [Bacteroidia bacterium]
MVRTDWTREEVAQIYNKPLIDLVFEAGRIHRENFNGNEVQMSTLLSIKTGGCPEDCAYCPQAARYNTGVKGTPLLNEEEILMSALAAKANGSSRFCMGAAWREVKDNRHFDQVVSLVKTITDMDMEVCCTLGMLNEHQAQRLKEAGLYAYNHNLDTSPEYYEHIITTRTYDDRLKTLENVRNAGISVCCGGIVGMGEQETDRIGLLQTLATLPRHPESVPINALVSVKGTPLGEQEKLPFWDMLRCIATARIIMPRSMVRLSAGRAEMSLSEQFLCFLAGANSIFAGEKLLTTPNPEFNSDKAMFELFGLKNMPAFASCEKEQVEA